MELVLTGAAACTAFDVVLILKKARQPIADCVVDADAERAAAEPRVFTRIHFIYTVAGRGLDPQQVERAVKLSKDKYCSATPDAGARPAAITYEIAIVEGDAACRRHGRARQSLTARSRGLRSASAMPSRSTRIRLDVSQRPPPCACTRA